MSIFIKCKVAFDSLVARVSESGSAIIAGTNWIYVRLVLMSVCVVQQFFFPLKLAEESLPVTWQSVPAVFIFGIVGLQFIIGIQAFNPMSREVWLRPAWKHNPFSLKQPLQFFHFGGWFMIAGALPYALEGIEGSEEAMFLAAILASFGAGMLFGVRVSVLICRRKFAHA